jgi:C_GCAxxG_C_C family probable redox protein
MEKIDSKRIIEERAAHYFSEGYNCCQSVLLAANDTWNLGMAPMIITAGRFFQHGMGSGSTCGALIGAQMALGILNERYGTGLKNKTAYALFLEFEHTFEGSECKDLRKSQIFTDKIGYKGCKRITQTTAGILYEFWENIHAQEQVIHHYSNLK